MIIKIYDSMWCHQAIMRWLKYTLYWSLLHNLYKFKTNTPQRITWPLVDTRMNHIVLACSMEQIWLWILSWEPLSNQWALITFGVFMCVLIRLTRKTPSKLLAQYEGNLHVIGGFSHKGPVMQSFDILFVMSFNNLSNKQSSCQQLLYETMTLFTYKYMSPGLTVSVHLRNWSSMMLLLRKPRYLMYLIHDYTPHHRSWDSTMVSLCTPYTKSFLLHNFLSTGRIFFILGVQIFTTKRSCVV